MLQHISNQWKWVFSFLLLSSISNDHGKYQDTQQEEALPTVERSFSTSATLPPRKTTAQFTGISCIRPDRWELHDLSSHDVLSLPLSITSLPLFLPFKSRQPDLVLTNEIGPGCCHKPYELLNLWVPTLLHAASPHAEGGKKSWICFPTLSQSSPLATGSDGAPCHFCKNSRTPPQADKTWTWCPQSQLHGEAVCLLRSYAYKRTGKKSCKQLFFQKVRHFKLKKNNNKYQAFLGVLASNPREREYYVNNGTALGPHRQLACAFNPQSSPKGKHRHLQLFTLKHLAKENWKSNKLERHMEHVGFQHPNHLHPI